MYSRSMGVSGECDIVEFHRAEDGIGLHGHRGLFRVFPVEYKKGSPKESEADILQLTAQAMCLEEMRQGHCITERFTAGIWWRLQMNCENG